MWPNICFTLENIPSLALVSVLNTGQGFLPPLRPPSQSHKPACPFCGTGHWLLLLSPVFLCLAHGQDFDPQLYTGDFQLHVSRPEISFDLQMCESLRLLTAAPGRYFKRTLVATFHVLLKSNLRSSHHNSGPLLVFPLSVNGQNSPCLAPSPTSTRYIDKYVHRYMCACIQSGTYVETNLALSLVEFQSLDDYFPLCTKVRKNHLFKNKLGFNSTQVKYLSQHTLQLLPS